MGRLTYLTMGHATAPGPVLSVPLAAPRIAAIYRARIAALAQPIDSEYVCWFDGAPDRFDDAWPGLEQRLLDALDVSGAAIAYCDETQPDRGRVVAGEYSLAEALKRPQMIHHAAICRLRALRAIQWPAGCYHWETLAYYALASEGFVYAPAVAYHWHPSFGGMHGRADTQRGMVNALRHLQGLEGVHFDEDFC